MLNLNGKSILVTGGTGSFGHAFTKVILEKWPEIKRLVIYSRDEQKQFHMSHAFPSDKYPMMRFFIGDVRDAERLKKAMVRVDYVIHAAAMKHVPIAEYNPMECIKTNIMGAENVINGAIENEVQKVVALSTDKAAAPINLYGATKLVSDKLFVAANNIRGTKTIDFSVVRYGNVIGSNGSVVPFFLSRKDQGSLPITSTEMTRFNISLEDGVKMVLFALEHAMGGEIFVPKIPSYRVTDVAKAIAPDADLNIIGIRPGEKIHEEMITSSDSYLTYDLGPYYAILPQNPVFDLSAFIDKYKATKVQQGFRYNSGENDEWLSVEDLRSQIRTHVDQNFSL